MNQVWNIFRKDFRHHWREIAASVALMVAFCWVEVREWSQLLSRAFGPAAAAYEILSSLVVPLVPISWMLLIVRVVQGESLVGDKQFWVTRPYDWKKLAAAKILFVLVFVNLPLFLADLFLLAMAGFRPWAYFGGLLWMQLLWILMLLLTTAALAAVTAGIGQVLLLLLFILLYAIAMSAVAGAIPNYSFGAGVGIYFLLIIVTALAVLLVQYSRRRTVLSRWIIAGLAIAITLIMVATPYRTLIERKYPPASAADFPLQLVLTPTHAPAPDEAMFNGNSVPISLFFRLSGLPQDSFAQLDGAILTLTNSNGQHWDSGWSGRNALLFPDQKVTSIDFGLRRDVFERMKSSPTHARLFLAFTLFQEKQQRPFTVPRGEFAMPELGLCTAGPQPWQAVSSLECRVPLRSPRFLLIKSEVAESTCPLPKDVAPAQPGEIARGYVRNGDVGPAEAGISPVKTVTVLLYDWNSPNSHINPGICAGSPLTLSDPEEVGTHRVEFQFDNFSLANYQRSSGAIQVWH